MTLPLDRSSRRTHSHRNFTFAGKLLANIGRSLAGVLAALGISKPQPVPVRTRGASQRHSR